MTNSIKLIINKHALAKLNRKGSCLGMSSIRKVDSTTHVVTLRGTNRVVVVGV